MTTFVRGPTVGAGTGVHPDCSSHGEVAQNETQGLHTQFFWQGKHVGVGTWLLSLHSGSAPPFTWKGRDGRPSFTVVARVKGHYRIKLAQPRGLGCSDKHGINTETPIEIPNSAQQMKPLVGVERKRWGRGRALRSGRPAEHRVLGSRSSTLLF